MRLLLLGCSGFVGRELVPFLLELGHELTLVSRQAQPFPALVGKHLSCIRLDPADPASWAHQGLEEALAQAEGSMQVDIGSGSFLEATAGEVLDAGYGRGVAEQGFGRHDYQRFLDVALHLAAEHVEEVRGRGDVRDLNVVLGADLQEALEARGFESLFVCKELQSGAAVFDIWTLHGSILIRISDFNADKIKAFQELQLRQRNRPV